MSLKAQLLNGIKFQKEVDIDFGGQVITFTLKPISNEEYENIQANINKGQKKYFDPKMAKSQFVDLEDATRKGFKANAEIFLKGIVSEEEWTVEDVRKLPAGLVDKVVDKILIISGIITGESEEEADRKKI